MGCLQRKRKLYTTLTRILERFNKKPRNEIYTKFPKILKE